VDPGEQRREQQQVARLLEQVEDQRDPAALDGDAPDGVEQRRGQDERELRGGQGAAPAERMAGTLAQAAPALRARRRVDPAAALW